MSCFRKALSIHVSSPDSLSSVINTLKKADGIPVSGKPLLAKIPDDAFEIVNGKILTKSDQKSIGHLEHFSRAGHNTDVLASLKVRGDPDAVRVWDSTSRAMYPDYEILFKSQQNNGIERSVRAHGGDYKKVAEAKTDAEIEKAIRGDPLTEKTTSKLQTLVKGGEFILVTGVTVAVGMYLYSKFSDAIALNSGCFVVKKNQTVVTYYRVLGYSCSEAGKRGDQLWVEQNKPVSPHPFADIAAVVDSTCGDDDKCRSCDIETLSEMGANVDSLDDSITIVCRESNVWDVIGDVANSVGVDVGNIISGAGGGLIESLFGGSLIDFIIGIVVAMGVFFVAKPKTGVPLGILIALCSFFIILYLTKRFKT